MSASSSEASFYALKAKRGDGKIQKMKVFWGKVVYATNISSKCALTDRKNAQFKNLAERHGDNLVILVFPDDIAKFAATKDFPGILMKRGTIQGEDATDVWKFFMDEVRAKDPIFRDTKVHFTYKFLVSKNGEVSYTNAEDLETNIQRLVNEEDVNFGLQVKPARR